MRSEEIVVSDALKPNTLAVRIEMTGHLKLWLNQQEEKHRVSGLLREEQTLGSPAA